MAGITGTQATRLHGGRIAGLVVFVALVIIALVSWFRMAPFKTPATETAEMNSNGFTAAQLNYEKLEVKPEPPPPAKVDTTAQQLALIMATLQKLQAEMGTMRSDIDALKKRPASTTVIQQEPKKDVKKAPAPMLYVAHDLKETGPPPPTTPQYTLAPTTKLPCVIETAIVSEVEGVFLCRISMGVWDTATGRHLLVPEGATILGKDFTSQLLYGNERVPTMSVSLTFPDGRTVDIGQAPITDQQGVAGLTGRVDQHWGRLFGAVIIGGVLRGGAMAMQSAAIGATGADQVIAGVGGTANQVVSTQVGRAMDTRPTIYIDAGQPAFALLTKPLSLPAMYE